MLEHVRGSPARETKVVLMAMSEQALLSRDVLNKHAALFDRPIHSCEFSAEGHGPL